MRRITYVGCLLVLAVSAQLAMAQQEVDPRGIWSNLCLNSESGDLNGMELLIMPSGGSSYQALVQITDGGFPFTGLINIDVLGSEVAFSVPDEWGWSDGEFTGVIAGRELVLQPPTGDLQRLTDGYSYWENYPKCESLGRRVSELPRLGSVWLGESFDTVNERLGRPLRVAIDSGAAFGTQIDYPGITIWAGFNQAGATVVMQIEATGADFCTSSDVCPGMTAAEVQRVLGIPDVSDSVKEGRNSYPVASDTCWLEVTVRDSKVDMLAIRCQP